MGSICGSHHQVVQGNKVIKESSPKTTVSTAVFTQLSKPLSKNNSSINNDTSKFITKTKRSTYKKSLNGTKKSVTFKDMVTLYDNETIERMHSVVEMENFTTTNTFSEIVLKNGDKFCGEIMPNGIMNGKGTYIFSNHNHMLKYEGEFFMNKKHGKGTITLKNCNIIHCNYFEDQIIFPVRIQFSNKDEYIGDMEDFCMSGFGEIRYFNSKDSYKGSFNYNMKDGFGRYQFSNGDIYEGQFSNDTMHGEGKYIHNSTTYEGIFQNGQIIYNKNEKNNKFELITPSLNEIGYVFSDLSALVAAI
jgi:hypothetical protein